jgi:hypothetical protein
MSLHESKLTDKIRSRINRKYPKESCGGKRDYWGEYDCEHEHSSGKMCGCEYCIYGPYPDMRSRVPWTDERWWKPSGSLKINIKRAVMNRRKVK